MKIQKNLNMPCLSHDQLSWGQVLRMLSKGNEIIFVTDKDKLEGCMTVGDIKRMLDDKMRSGGGDRPPLEQIINRTCKRIVFKGEGQTKKEAEEIFEKHFCIHNIPVVDEQGKLCFQYQIKMGTQKERVWKQLCYINNSEYIIDNFFRPCGNKKYIITGTNKEILDMTEKFFQNKTLEYGIEKYFDSYDLQNISKRNKQDYIICTNNAEKLYCLLTNKDLKSNIICLDEIIWNYDQCASRFASFLTEVTEQEIKIWIDLFEYDTIYFNVFDDTTLRLKVLMEKCGLKVYEKTGDMGNNNLVMTSCKKQYIDNETSMVSLGIVLEIISAYHYIMGKNISRTEYVQSFLFVLKEKIKKEKLIYEYRQLNILDYEIYDQLNKIESVQYYTDIAENQNYNNLFISEAMLRDEVMISLMEDCVIQKLRKCTQKIYIHRHINVDKFKFFPDRTFSNLKDKNKDCFEQGFLEDIYGDKCAEADEIVNDCSCREAEMLHTCYTKICSNLHTKNFSTDLYGNPKILNSPKKYYATVYLIGTCIYTGYAVSDEEKVCSYLQKEINHSGKSYRVVAFNGINGLWRKYIPVIESKIQTHDIVVVMPLSFFIHIQNDHLICIDWEEIDKKLLETNWYWETPAHCNYHAYEIIAHQIYEKIEKDLIEEYFPKFALKSSLETKIFAFINDLETKLQSAASYTKFLQTYDEEKSKAGAVIMNCNPFTLGHLYLVETAARLVNLLYIFVVEEDKSEFHFQERIAMVKAGTAHIPNVVVLPSGKFMISTITFGGYFSKDKLGVNCYDSFLDLKIFAHYIAPSLKISMRFVGEEPFDKVTGQYNKDMKVILGGQGITVIEIPRKEIGSSPISATMVRKLLKEGDWETISKLVPESTQFLLKQRLKI